MLAYDLTCCRFFYVFQETLQDFERDRLPNKHIEQAYIGQRLARIPKEELYMVHRSPKKQVSKKTNSILYIHNYIFIITLSYITYSQ